MMIEIKPARIDTIGALKDFLSSLPNSVHDSEFIIPDMTTIEYNSIEGLIIKNDGEMTAFEQWLETKISETELATKNHVTRGFAIHELRVLKEVKQIYQQTKQEDEQNA